MCDHVFAGACMLINGSENYITGEISDVVGETNFAEIINMLMTNYREKNNGIRNTMLQPADRMLQPADRMLQPADRMLQPADTMLQPADTMLQPADTMLQPADTMLQPADRNDTQTQTDIIINRR